MVATTARFATLLLATFNNWGFFIGFRFGATVLLVGLLGLHNYLLEAVALLVAAL
jgi:hypothetical protein